MQLPKFQNFIIMEIICPKTPKCRLFNNNLLKRPETIEIYKSGYCNNRARYKECKRFIVSETVGQCPDFVLPNSSLSLDEIFERMKKEGSVAK